MTAKRATPRKANVLHLDSGYVYHGENSFESHPQPQCWLRADFTNEPKAALPSVPPATTKSRVETTCEGCRAWIGGMSTYPKIKRIRAWYWSDTEGMELGLKKFRVQGRDSETRDALRRVLSDVRFLPVGAVEEEIGSFVRLELDPFPSEVIQRLVVDGYVWWSSWDICEFEFERVIKITMFPGCRASIGRALAFLSRKVV